MQKLTQGVLIALEGIDGSGKTTVARMLSELLINDNYDVISTKEPGSTVLGVKIREIVQTQDKALEHKAEFLLFAADRAQHFTEVVIPALAVHKIVISDRMADSSLAYQGYGRNVVIEYIEHINHWVMNGIMPHITFYVRIPVADALERIKKTRPLSAFEKEVSFLERVLCGFEMRYESDKRSDVVIIDGKKSVESLAHETYTYVKKWIQENDLMI